MDEHTGDAWGKEVLCRLTSWLLCSRSISLDPGVCFVMGFCVMAAKGTV